MSNRALCLLILLVAFAAQPVVAAEKQKDSLADASTEDARPAEESPAATALPVVEETIVVTAERSSTEKRRLSSSITVIDAADLQLLPVRDLSEVLQLVPGFSIPFSHPGSGRPMIVSRGFFGGGEVEYVRLLVDGTPVGDLESGLINLGSIPLEAVERLEVLRSAGSSEYGDTSMGGVIHIITRPDAENPNPEWTSGSISAGSFGSGRASAVHRRSGEGNLLVIAGIDRTDGYRDHSTAHQGSVRLSGGDRRWSFDAAGENGTREEPGLLSREELRADRTVSNSYFRDDEEDYWRGRASARYDRPFPGRSHLSMLLYGNARESEGIRTLLLAPDLPDSAHRATGTRSLGASLEGRYELPTRLGSATFRAVLDLEKGWLDTVYRSVAENGTGGSRLSDLDASRDRVGMGISGDWSPTPRIRLSGGLRFDRIDDDAGDIRSSALEAVSPRIGINIVTGDGLSPVTLWVQASTAFRAPALDQRFDPRPFPDFAGGTFTISNPQLEPQTAETLEAGASAHSGPLRWEISAYHMDVDDEIDFDPATFTYRNIGATVHQGLELDFRLQAAGRFRPFLTYALMKVESRAGENRGRQLKNIPLHTVTAGGWVALPGRATISPQVRWMDQRFLDDANEFSLGAPLLVDLRLEKKFSRALRVGIDLLNVTRERYSEAGVALADFEGGLTPYYFPAPGASARVFVDWLPKR